MGSAAERKKELKALYKQRKEEMGIFIIRSKSINKCYIESTNNLRGNLNGTKFKLQLGSHHNRELQQDWSARGEDDFSIEIIDKLPYDEDESKEDYTEELQILKLIWEDKLANEGWQAYKMSIKG